VTEEAIRFFLPGPTYVRRAVREAMLAEVVGHRSVPMRRLYESVAPKLPPIFRTDRDVYIATSSATLVMQSAIMSTAAERVLHLICGAFSHRWYEIAVSLGRQADKIEVPWGEAIDPEVVRQALRRRRYDAVTFAHCETSTSVLNPAEALAAVIREESDAMVIVDAVSTIAGAPVEVDDWGLDVVLTGSQKALSLPPGLAFFTLSERAERRAESVENRGFYTDMLRYRANHRTSGTITTPAMSILFAADMQLDRILEEGVEACWDRHARNRQMVEEWVAERDWSFLAHSHRSPTVSCLRPPEGVDAQELVAALGEEGWTISGGYGKLKPETVRIGHMGEVGPEHLKPLLEVIDLQVERLR
jgi:aspartate aminotransferase-like enzyme